MRLRVLLLASVLFVSISPVRGQQIKDPAEVLPAGTLGYVELRQPGPLAKEVAGLFKGSVLSNVPDSLARLRARPGANPMGGPQVAGMFGLLVSPEVIAELGRMQGGAVAFTSLPTDKDPPEYVVIILPGESNAPGLVMRSVLTAVVSGSARTSPDGKVEQSQTAFEPVGDVEGVKLYRQVERQSAGPGAGPDGRQSGPALAMMPGALLIGTPGAVKDVIRRAKGKAGDPSLASIKAFQEARRELGRGPGLFTYNNAAATLAALDPDKFGPQERESIAAIKGLLNPKVLSTSASGLALERGTLTYRAAYQLNPEEKSPVLDVLPSAGVKEELLRFAPPDASLFAALGNADGEKRWEKMLDLADRAARAAGTAGPLPSEQVGQCETGLGLKIGKDILGRIGDVAVALPGPRKFLPDGDKGKGGAAAPPVLVIVRANGEEDAQALAQDVIPKTFGMATNQPNAKPAKQEVDGQEVATLTGERTPPLSFGRQGAVLVLGSDPALVAASLNGGKKQGLLGDERVKAALKEMDGPLAFVVTKPATLGTLGAMYFTLRSAAVAAPPGAKPPEADRKMEDFLRLVEKEEPLVLGLTRKPDRILLEARYTGLDALIPRLADYLAEQGMQLGVSPPKAPPPPPPPPKPGTDR
jgi:hypothetical protein